MACYRSFRMLIPRGYPQKLRDRIARLSDAETAEAIHEARALAPSSDDARAWLNELTVAAAQRFVEANGARQAARSDYWRAFWRRAFLVTWWVHFAGVALLCLLAEDLSRSRGRPEIALAFAVGLAGGFVVVRWLVTGRWRFGPSR